MTLVPLLLDLCDGALNPVVAGSASLTPSVQLTDPGTGITVESGPSVAFRPSNPVPLTWILPTDASGWAPSGWGWDIAFSGVPGNPDAFSFKIASSGFVWSFTTTDASPAVFTAAGSSLSDGTAVALAPGDSLPGGFRSGLVYYVVSASGATFSLAATPGGSAIASTSTGSGTVGVVQYLSALSPVSSVTTMAAYAQVNAGDLDGPGGSSADPKVSGLQGVPVSATAPTSGQVLGYNGSEWLPETAGTGTVTSVTAADPSIVVSGTDTVNPSIATGTLDVIAAQHPPAANVPMNARKLTGLANGSAATDSAAFGQLPSVSSPLPLSQGGTGVSESTDAALLAALGAAPLASPALTGSPTAPTQTTGDNSTKLATDQFVTTAVAGEATRAEAAEALLAPLASPALTGSPTAPTKSALTNNTDIATTAYTDAAVAVETSRAETAEGLLAPKASPALTGTPTAPTASALTDSTQLATTAYADSAVAVEKARALAAEASAQSAAEAASTPVLTQTAVQTGNANALANTIVPTNTTSGSLTITLPNAPAGGTIVAVKMVTQGGTNTTTVACAGSDVYNKSGGGTSLTLPLLNQGVLLQYDAGIWVVLSDDLPLSQLEALFLQAGSNLSDVASRQVALNNLAGAATSGQYLRGNGTSVQMSAIQAADVPTLNQNTTGTASNITDTLDQVPHAAASVNLNSQKITSLANGSASTDAAAYGQTPAGGNTVTVAEGGTGQTSANAAYNALSPMTTVGDIEYEGSGPAATRLAGPTSATKQFLTSTGTGSAAQAPAWGTIAAGDLPAATTSAQGAVELDGTAGDIQPVGAAAAAGNSTKAAAANHVHVGLLPSNNLSDVGSASTALANLGGLVKQTATAAAGYTLINGTGTVISWTTPNDGALHWVMVFGAIHVTGNETGGQITVNYTLPDGTSTNHSLWAAGQAAGDALPSQSFLIPVEANTTVSVRQNTALTAGAAVFWAGIWGL